MTEHRCNVEYCFLEGKRGRLFAAYYTPPPDVPSSGAIMCIPPFAEEMNKTRRMVALQSREFATRGKVVLVVDLYGCGDSQGELQDTTIHLWMDDLASCMRWLEERAGKVDLWGIRFGGLLALSLVGTRGVKCSTIILWQPVLSGRQMINEFLRLGVASSIMEKSESRISTRYLIENLEKGEMQEISGYLLSPELYEGIIGLNSEVSCEAGTEIFWFNVVRDCNAPISNVMINTMRSLSEIGVHVRYKSVIGVNFWNSGDIYECPELIDACNKAYLVGQVP